MSSSIFSCQGTPRRGSRATDPTGAAGGNIKKRSGVDRWTLSGVGHKKEGMSLIPSGLLIRACVCSLPAGILHPFPPRVQAKFLL